jgi:hypothetical protein
LLSFQKNQKEVQQRNCGRYFCIKLDLVIENSNLLCVMNIMLVFSLLNSQLATLAFYSKYNSEFRGILSTLLAKFTLTVKRRF